ncbi:MAG TPA: LamG-like jellyroll fold domain-containing protein [Ginsengibacter sp.]
MLLHKDTCKQLATSYCVYKRATIIFLVIIFTFTTSFSQVGASLNFDGIDDGVNCSASPAFNISVGTIEAWVRPTASSNGDMRIIVTKLPTPSSIGSNLFTLFLDNVDKFRLNISVGGMSYDVESVTTPTLNMWYHVAATYDGDTIKIYVNGVLENINTDPDGLMDVGTGEVVIGNTLSGAAAGKWEGDLDEVRYWSVVRSQSQIQSTMNCELSSAVGLVANYHFNQGIAGGNNASVLTATDASGNNLNGTLFNFALSGATSNWVEPGAVTTGVTCTGSLPLSLIDFKAVVAQKKVSVVWTVAQEIDIEEYMVQRSANGRDFNSIATVKASNAPGVTNYSATDANPLNGNNYYRLIIKERDGSHVSKVVVIKNASVNNSFGVVQLGNNLNIRLQDASAGDYKVMLVNSNGQLVKFATLMHNGTDATKQINVESLPKGVYRVVLRSANINLTQSILLQ